MTVAGAPGSPARNGRLSVALDVSAVPSSPAGAGRYIVELSRALARTDGVTLTLVARRDDRARWEEVAPGCRVITPVPSSRPARLAFERSLLGPVVERLSGPAIDVYHGPHYTMPATLRVRRVVTVHDVTFLEHPEWHERSKVPFFKAAIRRAARRADVVVCVSSTTATRLGRLMEVSGEIVVAEHGVAHPRFCPGPVSGLPEGLDRHELVVHVGTLEPRKGVVDLVRAFDKLAGTRQELRLVLAGLAGWGADEVEAAVAASPHRARIDLLGFVPDETVVGLLRAASVVAYPSHDEGFGLPALEAMATGAPLVTTKGTAMEEFAGGVAFLTPPGDPVALAGALERALEATAEERSRRREEGMRRAGGFTWERTAEVHLEAYEKAASGRR